MPELRLAKARQGYEGYVYEPPQVPALLQWAVDFYAALTRGAMLYEPVTSEPKR